MYDTIYRECPSMEKIFGETPSLVLYYLLGRRVQGITDNEMMCLWCISGYFICKMYEKAISTRVGIR